MQYLRLVTFVAAQATFAFGGSAFATHLAIPVHAELERGGDGIKNGRVELTVGLYKARANLTPMFEERQVVDVVDGRMTFYVGASKTLTLNEIPEDGALWLGLTVDGESLSPRVRFGAVPYAYRAQRALVADRVEGLDVDDVAHKGHIHRFGELSGIPEALLDGDDVRTDAEIVSVARQACYSGPAQLHDVLDGRYSHQGADPYASLVAHGRLDGDQVTDLMTWASADTRYLHAGAPVPGNLVVDGRVEWASPHEKTVYHSVAAFMQAEPTGAELRHDGSMAFFTEDSEGTSVRLVRQLDLPVDARLRQVSCYVVDDDDGGLMQLRASVTARPLLDPSRVTVGDLEEKTGPSDANADIREFQASVAHTVAADTAYVLTVDLETDARGDRLRFYGCRIFYETDGIR